jgi:hypothetical protein
MSTERHPFVTFRDAPFGVAALLAGVTLLYLGRSLTFWHDEWRSITFDGSGFDYLRPVNEHWSTFPLLLYRATFHFVELRSYIPYLAELIALHLVAVTGAYVLVRRRLGAFYATLLALPLLFLGIGGENLVWAFQTGFVGSVLFGVWALVLVEQDGRAAPALASGLLVASLMSSGIGLFFVVVVACRTLLDDELRRRAWCVGPPLAAYATWHLLVGRDAVGETGDLGGPCEVARFAFRGIGHAFEAWVGADRLPTGGALGVMAFVALCLVAGRRVLRGREGGALAAGCLAGIASMYVVIGIVRAGLEFDYATLDRYVYVAAFLVVVTVADLLSGRHDQSAAAARMRSPLVVGAVGLGLAWVLVVNANALENVRASYQYQADLTRAIFALAIEHEGEDWIDPGPPLDAMPPAADLPQIAGRFGSPLEDAYFPSVVRTPSQEAYADAKRALARKTARG